MERETAMKILKELHDNSLFSNRIALEVLIPELADSNDERIRKCLIDFFEDWHENKSHCWGIAVTAIIAWLEKQGINYSLVEEMKKRKDSFMREKEKAMSSNDKLSLGARIAMLEELLVFVKEKQGERKPVLDFKASNWYVSKVDGKIHDMTYNPADKVEPFDKYEGLTDFERTLADICIGWIGEELGWKQYIKDNADVLLKIAIKKFNSIQDAPFKQKPAAWSEEDELIVLSIKQVIQCASSLNLVPEKLDKVDKWLKSLKDRIGE